MFCVTVMILNFCLNVKNTNMRTSGGVKKAESVVDYQMFWFCHVLHNLR